MQTDTKILRVLIIEDTLKRKEILQNLYKNHAWILVDSSHRAIRMIQNYEFDIISLDYNIKGEEEGDKVAEHISKSINKNTQIIIHSMNHPGALRISNYLPNALIYPISKIIKTNDHFKFLRNEIDRFGKDFDWFRNR